MQRLKSFVVNTLLGGLVVMLPVALMVFLIHWAVLWITGTVEPLADLIVPPAAEGDPGSNRAVATAIAVALILAVCFFVGLLVRTRLGGWTLSLLENSLLKKIPGYSLIRETVSQLLGAKQSPFSTVALAAPYGNETLVSCFVTDRHENGWFTIFVPTGPNPTSGNMFHLPPEQVFIVKVSVEYAMRSIISCGAGSTELLNAMKAARAEADEDGKRH